MFVTHCGCLSESFDMTIMFDLDWSVISFLKRCWDMMWHLVSSLCPQLPRAVFWVVRIDLLHFLAGCCKSRLYQAIFVLM